MDWDATDLILQLTRNEPTERPYVATVIYHPYFALANDHSKTYFEEMINNYFLLHTPYHLSQNEYKMQNYQNVFRQFFCKSNVQTWIDLINTEKDKERNKEKKEALEKVLKALAVIRNSNVFN